MNEEQYHDLLYGSKSDFFEGKMFSLLRRRVSALLLSVCGDQSSAMTVLSIGSGDGFYEVELAPSFAHITGVDISVAAVQRSRSRAGASGVTNVEFIHGDIRRISTTEQRYDCVWMLGTLHHLDGDGRMLVIRKSFECLRKNGILVTVDPNSRRLVRLFKIFFTKHWARYHSPDEREISPSATRVLLTQAGFENVSVGYTDFFVGPLAWVSSRPPALFARCAMIFDSVLLKVPILRLVASSFSLVACKAPSADGLREM